MNRPDFRWWVVLFLFLATTINYMDRQLIGLLKPVLEKEFVWSESDFAYIIMSFTAAYAIGLPVMGWLIDRIGTKAGYALAVVIWSVAGMCHALAGSVTGFFIARFALGLGEAGNFPAAVKTVSEWFPPRERGLATGIFNAGTSIGVVIALLITPFILFHFGWREVFLITGAVGFLWLLAWLFWYRPAEKKNSETIPAAASGIPWKQLFFMRQTWAIIIGKLLIDPIYWFFLFWLPSFFATRFTLDFSKPSWPLMIIYLATTIGAIGGGGLSSWLIKKGMSAWKARNRSLLIFATIELLVLGIPFISDMWLAVLVLSIAVAVHQGWATNIFTLAGDLFPKEVVSSVVGIAGMAGAIGGMVFPLLVGALLDYYKLLGDINRGYNCIFWICGIMYFLAFLLIRLLLRKVPVTQQ